MTNKLREQDNNKVIEVDEYDGENNSPPRNDSSNDNRKRPKVSKSFYPHCESQDIIVLKLMKHNKRFMTILMLLKKAYSLIRHHLLSIVHFHFLLIVHHWTSMKENYTIDNMKEIKKLEVLKQHIKNENEVLKTQNEKILKIIQF